MTKDFRFELKETADSININPISLEADLWEKYPGAFGNAKECIEGLLQEEYDIADLCECISHQMGFYPALYLAMPYAVEWLFEHDVLFDPQVAICLATDFKKNRLMRSGTDEDIRNHFEPEILEAYEQSVKKFRLMTIEFLNEHIEEIREYEPEQRSYFATAMLAVLGDREAAFALMMNCWDACYMCCDECDYFDEDIVLSDESCEAIEPAKSLDGQWDGKSFDDTYLWFSNCLKWMGASDELELLAYYYGSYEWPECGKKVTVMDFVKNYYFYE